MTIQDLLTPERFRHDGDDLDAQAELAQLTARLSTSNFADAARPFILSITKPFDFGKRNPLSIGAVTINTDASVGWFSDLLAPMLWLAEVPAALSESKVMTDRQGRPRLTSDGKPVGNRWFGVAAVAVIYLPKTTQKSAKSGKVFSDDTDPECLFPGLLAFRSVEEAERLHAKVLACVKHLRAVGTREASGLQDMAPTIEDADDVDSLAAAMEGDPF